MSKARPRNFRPPIKKILPKVTIQPPKVSVILSSYNHANYIAAAIQSVLDQTFTDFELLIYDDGSIDGSRDVIKTFDDPRIKTFLYEENRGPRLAAQECFAAAKGTYIAIHHSDDTWSTDKLAKQVEFLDAHEEYAACFTLADFIDEDGNLQTLDEGDFYATVFDKPNRSRAEWLNYFFYNGNCLCHPSLLIRRESYAKFNMYDVQGLWQLPDYFMWINLCFHANFYIMHEKLVQFRLRLKQRDNMSASAFDKRIRGESEMYFVLDNFIKNFYDDKFFLEVFPDAKKFVVNGKINRNFAFAQICLENSDTPFSGTFQLIALNLLKKILSSTKSAAEVKALYNYDEKTFLRDTGNIDVFNLAQKLSLPHGILFFDYGEDFNNDAKVDKYIFVETSGNFYAKYFFNAAQPVKNIRFDPDDNFISIKLDAFTVNGKNLSVANTNAAEIVDGFYRFLTNDPQIYFNTDLYNLIGDLIIEVRGKFDKGYSKILNESIAQIQSDKIQLESENAQLENKNSSLASQNEHLQTVNKNLDEYNDELKNTVQNLSAQISELENVNHVISQYNDELENANNLITQYTTELENANQTLLDHNDALAKTLEMEIASRDEQIASLSAQLAEFTKLKDALLTSTSWKVTAPLRSVGSFVRKILGRKPTADENLDTNLKLKVYRTLTDPKVKNFVHKAEEVCEEKFPTVHEKILLPTKAAAKSALLKFAASKNKSADGVKLWKLSKSKFDGLVSV
ncbi:MAG: glycosyltransferase, partial [Selenomonadaceae bacterium]|nr:glycosyltransferase [Selenomonadaceae bacterium]